MNLYFSTFSSTILINQILPILAMNSPTTHAAIIPAYNEEKTIAEVVSKTKQFCPHVIVVDDGSSDSTSSQAQQAGATVLKHKVNLGKGAALKTGCEHVFTQGISKEVIVLDADGQHDPKEIPKFIVALQEHEVVFGYRKVPSTMPLMMRLGNIFINKALRVLYNVQIQDSQCGYRAFTAAAYQKMRWDTLDYYVETEMILNVGKKRLKHIAIPIDTIYMDKYKGTTVLDGVKIVAKMMGGRLW